MPYKACVYKGCENYTYDCAPCGNKKFTLFRFPKEPARYEQWMKRGKVIDGLPETQMLMCSDHFEGKYIVRNARRTMLTNTAVPLPYHEEIADMEEGENNIERECEVGLVKIADALDTEMVFSIHGDLNDSSTLIRVKESGCEDDDEDGLLEYDRVDNNLEAEYCVESTTTMTDADDVQTEVKDIFLVDRVYEEEHLSGTIRHPGQKEISFKGLKTNSIRRRITNSSTDETQEPSSSKVITSKFNNLNNNSNDNGITASKRKINQRSEDNNKYVKPKLRKENETRQDSPKINSESLVNAGAVICFIFKGEEYVQMPKEYYIQEKVELMEKLNNYEKILRTFKQNLLNLDLP
uniref:THAP-type domain-containing protein n=1 Tax=Bactrocera dorsalis TaxID=27457 RepID=A0A034WYA5_BACDO